MSEKYGKEREFSFIDSQAARWLEEEAPEDGLCLARFRADITADGVHSWQEGKTVELADGRRCEITKVGKRCFSECELLKRTGEKCPLAGGVAFGKTI
ncbi:MAG: hypothetical protein IJB73_00820 [Firmicutes bacterium]|nr:hypothetical protein [Bacillota bacterium]